MPDVDVLYKQSFSSGLNEISIPDIKDINGRDVTYWRILIVLKLKMLNITLVYIKIQEP